VNAGRYWISLLGGARNVAVSILSIVSVLIAIPPLRPSIGGTKTSAEKMRSAAIHALGGYGL